MLKLLQDDPDMKLSPDMHFRCFTHVLNLAVQITMESMKSGITAIRETAHATRYPPRKMNQLEDYAWRMMKTTRVLQIKFLIPVMDVKTR